MDNTVRIKYNGKGFWIHEAFIEVFSEFFYRAMKNFGLQNLTENLQDLYLDFDSNRNGGSEGFAGVLLDDSIITATDKSQFLNVLNDAQSLISNEGNELSLSWLNNFVDAKYNSDDKRYWTFPIKTQSLITTLDYIEQLIDGSWPYTFKRVHYIGFPDDNAELVI
jgi:hypothetical protein